MVIKWIGAHKNNFSVGRVGNKIDKVVIHWIVGTLESADSTFASPTRLASAHYGVGDNDIHQYVKEEDTAWHAGNLLTNRQSIGIENEGGPNLPVSEATIKTLANLVKDICSRYNIPLDRAHIKGHKEVSDKPTACPGTIDIDKVISLAKGQQTEPDMTDDQKRALEIISKFQIEAKHGNLEGAANAAVGAARDLPNKDAQIATLSQKVLDLDTFTKKLQEQINILSSEVKSNNDIILDWQTKFTTANEQVRNATEELEQANKDKNDYRRRYEELLKDSPEKKTVVQLLKLVIKKLSKK